MNTIRIVDMKHAILYSAKMEKNGISTRKIGWWTCIILGPRVKPVKINGKRN
jgi:hypothetical protein